MFEAAMTTHRSALELLPEETHVRVGENALVASLTFAFFWASFGLAWLVSNKHVPEFRAFPAEQKADWCSRYVFAGCIASCASCSCSYCVVHVARDALLTNALFLCTHAQRELDDPRDCSRRWRCTCAHVHLVGQRVHARELHSTCELHLLCRCVVVSP